MLEEHFGLAEFSPIRPDAAFPRDSGDVGGSGELGCIDGAALGEADYARDPRFGPTNRAMLADDENAGGSQSVITAKGVMIHDLEGIEDGSHGLEFGFAESPCIDDSFMPLGDHGGPLIATAMMVAHHLI